MTFSGKLSQTLAGSRSGSLYRTAPRYRSPKNDLPTLAARRSPMAMRHQAVSHNCSTAVFGRPSRVIGERRLQSSQLEDREGTSAADAESDPCEQPPMAACKRRNVRQIQALQGFARRSLALLKAFEVSLLKPPPLFLKRVLCTDHSWTAGAGPAARPDNSSPATGWPRRGRDAPALEAGSPDLRQRIRLQPSSRPKKRRLRSQACCAHTGSYWVIGMRPEPTAVSLANPCWAR